MGHKYCYETETRQVFEEIRATTVIEQEAHTFEGKTLALFKTFETGPREEPNDTENFCKSN